MNLTLKQTLPSQEEIEIYLPGFFREWAIRGANSPQTLQSLVELVKDHFKISAEASALLSEKYGEKDRTILGTLVHFALLRLEEQDVIIRIGTNLFQLRTEDSPRSVKIPKDDLNRAIVSLKQLKTACQMGKEAALNLLRTQGKPSFNEAALLSAAASVFS